MIESTDVANRALALFNDGANEERVIEWLAAYFMDLHFKRMKTTQNRDVALSIMRADAKAFAMAAQQINTIRGKQIVSEVAFNILLASKSPSMYIDAFPEQVINL